MVKIYLWCALGIAISVLLPILWQIVYSYFPKPPTVAAPDWEAVWQLVKAYLILMVASLLTAILIVAILGDTLTDYRAALLAGYAWDSTLQKFATSRR